MSEKEIIAKLYTERQVKRDKINELKEVLR